MIRKIDSNKFSLTILKVTTFSRIRQSGAKIHILSFIDDKNNNFLSFIDDKNASILSFIDDKHHFSTQSTCLIREKVALGFPF